jgi:hypothetical protein
VNPFGPQNLAIGIVVNKGHDYSNPSSNTLLPVAVFKYQQFFHLYPFLADMIFGV